MTFEEIYQLNKNRVYNLSLHYVQNIEDAEEITQDVFVSVNQSLHLFNEKSKISTWIYRIAINKSLDFIKAKNRKKRFKFIASIFINDSNELKYDMPEFNHPGVQLEHKQALEILFNKINKLPDNQKTVLILSKIEHKSQSEIAEIMTMSIKAIESLFQRAKRNLEKSIIQSKEN